MSPSGERPRSQALAMSRQEFLTRAGALVALGGAGGLLGACGGGGSGGGSSAKKGAVATWTYQMVSDWNMEYLGEWAAQQKGYYSDVGLDVKMVPGSPTTTAQVYVTSGHGDVSLGGGTSSQVDAVTQGVPATICAALYNENPRAIISLAKNPISTIDDLYGKTIGVPPDAQSDWKLFLKKNNVDASKIHVVPSTFDVGPLVAGTWDGMQGLATNQPAALRGEGIEPHVMRYADFGMSSVANTWIVATKTVASRRDELKRFLYAQIRGWRYALTHLEEAVHGVVDQYGKKAGLDYDKSLLIAKAQSPFILTDWTKKHGILTVSGADIKKNLATVALGGLHAPADKVFDLSVLDEVYQEHPDLRAWPA